MANINVLEEEQLVKAAQQGEWDAFSKLYQHYLPVVYRRVTSKIPTNDVEDVVQESFIAVMKSLKNFRHEARFSTWLRTVVNRQIADYYRRRKPQDTNAVELDGENTERFFMLGTQINPAQMDHMIIVRQELNSLPDHYQEIILMRFADGLQFNEIAELQGQSLEATKSLYRRAIAALQQRINDV